MSHQIQTHTLLQARTGLYSLANQYIPHDSAPEGPTLVFAHSTSTHKEQCQWEIIIGKIFELLPGRINEAWAIDWQNHGNSAVLNDHALQTKTRSRIMLISCVPSSSPIMLLGKDDCPRAFDGDMTLAIFRISLPVSPIPAVIMFKPVHILPPVTANDDRILKGKLNVRGVQSRQTTFASREEASIWARKRVPWKIWDDRMFQCYLCMGYSESVLKCTHVVRDRFFDGKEGRSMATVQIIPKAGHLLVQEKPDTAAETIVSILREAVQPGGKARL
ncbi:hypothetical protein DFH06DRAFT_1368198 [Mycena polygramma]|nr:hypothetical protein DFH06DRAFT_1368198 [Mycena polygramma]